MDFSMFENMRFSNSYQRPVNNNSMVMHTGSGHISRFPEETPLAMAYVPMQQWSEVYNEEEAFSAGTLFPELNLPFEPEEGCHG